MPIAGYLLRIPQGKFAPLNRALEKALTRTRGNPLVPVSSERALIPVAPYKDARAALGAAALRKLLAKHRVSQLEPVDDARFLELVRSRDPVDLPPLMLRSAAPVRAESGGESFDWHLVDTRLVAAWKLLGGRENIDWTGVTVGHIDTGWTFHPGLGFSGEQENSPWVDTVHDRDLFPGDFPQSGDAPFPAPFPVSQDCARDPLTGPNGGHGTKTLSVLSGFNEAAGAREGGLYAGHFGAAPRVPVVCVRLTNTIWASDFHDTLPAAIDHLVNNAGCKVISMSMGSPHAGALSLLPVPQALRRALDNAYERGVIFCCAAGNHIPNADVIFPARCPRTIAVGGTTKEYQPWTGSSFGAQVDICAPATPIRHAHPAPNGHYNYKVGDGTSYATPQVAGAAALWLAFRRDEIAQRYTQPWQIVAAYLRLLKATATVPSGWETNQRGAGILNAEALLNEDLPDPALLVKDELPY
jgi:subtilisin family serine protease